MLNPRGACGERANLSGLIRVSGNQSPWLNPPPSRSSWIAFTSDLAMNLEAKSFANSRDTVLLDRSVLRGRHVPPYRGERPVSTTGPCSACADSVASVWPSVLETCQSRVRRWVATVAPRVLVLSGGDVRVVPLCAGPLYPHTYRPTRVNS